MFQPRSIQSSLSFRDKLLSIDYILVISILILGIVSMFAMYSTDGGEFKYHTKSHILRFSVFFVMFFVLSFIQIRFWHSTSYLIYFFFLILCGHNLLLLSLLTCYRSRLSFSSPCIGMSSLSSDW